MESRKADTSSLLARVEACDGHSPSRWVWCAPRPPTAHELRFVGFAGSEWCPACRSDPSHDAAGNLLLVLHGLGDTPAPFAQFARRLSLPQTCALALRAPLPLPLGLPGGMWHESFEADGNLIDGRRSRNGRGVERRRLDSLERETRSRLLRLLELLTLRCGWEAHNIHVFGFAQVSRLLNIFHGP